MSDNKFMNTLMIIGGILVGSTIGVLALANVLISDADYAQEVVIQGNVEDRIKPVGSVHTTASSKISVDSADTSAATPATPTQQVADAGRTAEQLYVKACAVCHTSGIMNAPRLGDRAGWQPRIARGVEQLYAGAINGIGTMPAKGGRTDYTDQEVKAIVDYMLQSVQ